MSGLPKGWATTTLGEIHQDRSESINPARYPSEEFELYSVPSHSSGMPEIIAGEQIGSNKQIVSPNTVLLCKINPRINRVWVVEPKTGLTTIASTEWIAFSPQEEINSHYLAYYLQQGAVRDYLAQNASGVGGSLMRVKASTLSSFPFVLAPRGEQDRIVAEIEKQFTRLDAATAALKRVQANLKRYRASVLKAACEGRLVPMGDASQVSSMVPVRDILREPLANGRSPQSSDTGAKILRLTAIKDGLIVPEEHRMGVVPAVYLEKLSIRDEDILISRGNGSVSLVGLAGLVVNRSEHAEPILFPDTMIRIRLDNRLCDPRYFVLVWNSGFVRNQIERAARTTAGIHKISQSDIERFEIPLPSLSDQLAIANAVERSFASVRRMEVVLRRAGLQIARLRASTLTAAFSGGLTSQNHEEEPAPMLLERIRTEFASQLRRKPPSRRKEPVHV